MPENYESAFHDALQKLGLAPPDPTVVEETIDKDKEEGTATVPDPGGVTVGNVWRHPDAHPLVLDLLLIQRFGPEWLTFEPETLQLLVPTEFHTQTLSDLNLSKLQACKTLHVSEVFWQRWECFTWLAMALNGEFPDFEVMQVPTVAQALVAADIATRVRTDVPWSPEVKAYLEQLHLHEGVLLSLPPLDFVHVPTSEIDVSMDKLRSDWSDVRRKGVAPQGSTMEDEQLRRLLQVNQYLEESRSRLRVQIAMVGHA